MTEDEIRKYLEEPGAHLFLNPDYTIAHVGQEYARETHITDPNSVIGRNLFDVFPDNPSWPNADGVANLRASLNQVRKPLEVDKMPIQRYDIFKPVTLGGPGQWEERWWSPTNIPLMREGKLVYIVHRVEDVTLLHALRQGLRLQSLKSRVFYILAIITIGLISFGYAHNTNRLNNIQGSTCAIQQRGLPAGHELAASMSDIHKLLTIQPSTPAERKAAALTPPDVKSTEEDLNKHLKKYLNIEAKQPKTRKC